VTWPLASTVLVAGTVGAGIAWYERGRPTSRLVALVAVLAALAVAGRVVFTPLPNVQATTDVVLLSGYALGPLPGFVVGAIGALASNFFLGQGPWTPWQMLGWGMAGVAGGALAAVAGRRLGRWPLAAVCALAGLAFGAWMDLFTLVSFAGERTARSYIAIAGVSLPFNVAHAIGNAVLCLALGPAFTRMLTRFRRRMEVRWVAAADPVRAGVAVLALAVLVGAGAGARPADAAPPAVRYLERAQNADGGFGGAPGQGSSQLITGWTVLGLEAAGRNPLDVKRAGRTPIDFMRSNAGQLKDTGELERSILALRGAGLDPRRFAGRDLVAELLRRRGADGSFERQSNLTAFGILALRAAGRSARSSTVARAAGWLARQQNPDGGFSFATRGGASFVDETGASIQALAAAGRRRGAGVKKALAFLRGRQGADGGFGQSGGYRSNAQSTAWAVQGIVAAGADPDRIRRKGSRSPVAFLASLRATDGSYRYSRTSTQSPVWVTGQVLAALERRALPIAPVKRRSRAAPAKRRARRSPRRSPATAPVRAPDRRRRVRSEPAPAAAPARPAARVSSTGGDEGSRTRTLVIVAVGAVAAATLVAVRVAHRRRSR
jgi:energy-coupling factor transport system substrate-specific component